MWHMVGPGGGCAVDGVETMQIASRPRMPRQEIAMQAKESTNSLVQSLRAKSLAQLILCDAFWAEMLRCFSEVNTV